MSRGDLSALITIAIMWVQPVLLVVAWRGWFRTERPLSSVDSKLFTSALLVVTLSFVVFYAAVMMDQIGGFGSTYQTNFAFPRALIVLSFIAVIGSFAGKSPTRYVALAASIITSALWCGACMVSH